MCKKYEKLFDKVKQTVEDIKYGRKTYDDLTVLLTESDDSKNKSCIYHVTDGWKSVHASEVAGYLKQGWSTSPVKQEKKRPDYLTHEQWKKCDERLSHQYGLSTSTFNEVMGFGKTDAARRDELAPVYKKVLAEYGTRIVLVDKGTYEIYLWKTD